MANAQQTPNISQVDTPLAVTVRRACELSGLGPTTLWAFIRDGRLEAVRVPGVRRTLIGYASLTRLLMPDAESPIPARKRGRPRQNAPATMTP